MSNDKSDKKSPSRESIELEKLRLEKEKLEREVAPFWKQRSFYLTAFSVLIAFVSFLFGIYEHFDKQKIEEAKAELEKVKENLEVALKEASASREQASEERELADKRSFHYRWMLEVASAFLEKDQDYLPIKKGPRKDIQPLSPEVGYYLHPEIGEPDDRGKRSVEFVLCKKKLPSRILAKCENPYTGTDIFVGAFVRLDTGEGQYPVSILRNFKEKSDRYQSTENMWGSFSATGYVLVNGKIYYQDLEVEAH